MKELAGCFLLLLGTIAVAAVVAAVIARMRRDASHGSSGALSSAMLEVQSLFEPTSGTPSRKCARTNGTRVRLRASLPIDRAGTFASLSRPTLVRTLAIALLIAAPLAADAVTDVRGALAGLKAREPVRVTYELQRSMTSAGKFDNDQFTGKVAVDLDGGPGGFHLILPQTLLDQIEREKEAGLRNRNLNSPTVRALEEISPVEASEALDFAPVLLRLMDGAKVLSDAAGTWQGKPARAVVLRVVDRLDDDDAKKLKITENRLTLWVGSDHVPLAAEHSTNAKFSFLIFKWEQKQKRSWHLARVADRLLRMRFEESQSGSGMGQKTAETVLATLRLR